jgi:hypothetical protein
LITPSLHRKKPKMQYGREPKCYRKKWTVERTFSWPSNFRRFFVRYQGFITIYSGFFHLARLMIVLIGFEMASTQICRLKRTRFFLASTHRDLFP